RKARSVHFVVDLGIGAREDRHDSPPGLGLRVLESAQHVEMTLGELEARAARLGDDGRGAERLPRAHLLRPAVGALARETNAALERQPSGITPGLARVPV